MVHTNMGRMSRKDYLEIMARQYGFDSYEELRAEGYSIDYKQPTIEATIVFHSIDKEKYEVTDIAFSNSEYDKLYEEYKRISEMTSINEESKMKLDEITGQMNKIENIREIVSEELGEYGSISKEIHTKLWNKDDTERYCCLNVSLWIEDHKNLDGEIETDIDYCYETSTFEKEWDKLDLLKKHDKIFPIDYEDHGSSYTIYSLSNVCANDYMKTGIYYYIHSDKLSPMTGYYNINVKKIDKEGNRYFSSPELAHEAYCKLKSIIKQKEDKKSSLPEASYEPDFDR